ncbi:hypothetical protein WMF45_01270 [Sorangium sp. So ce448]|uniref:hypothetical protein n=1 Tax=Sorangium sp. So ce448 TaxID=3133314 RepID=UPI003F611236
MLFVGLTALGGVACTSGGATESTGESQAAIRSVRGHLKSGTAATSVVATVAQAGSQEAKTYSAAIDAQGNFRLTLPKRARYVLGLMKGDEETAHVQFASVAGGELTSLLPVANPPAHEVRAQTRDDSDDDIDLGEVDESDGRCDRNPLDQVDWDSDGTSDYEDADDDDDGTADADDEDNHHPQSGWSDDRDGDDRDGRDDECEEAGYEEAGYEDAGYEEAGYEDEGDEEAGYEEAGYEDEGDEGAGYEDEGDEGAGGGEEIAVPTPG